MTDTAKAKSNFLSPAEIKAVSDAYGVAMAKGECSRIDLGIRLFEIAATGAKVDGKTEYLNFANAAIAADTRKALRIDLDNKKAVATRGTELNAFINLAARNVKKRQTLFARTIKHVDAMDVKPVLSMWNCLVKVCTAQTEAVDRNLTDDDIKRLLPPKPDAAKKNRAQALAAIVDACAKYEKRFDQGANDVGDVRQTLAERVARMIAGTIQQASDDTLTDDGEITDAPDQDASDAASAAVHGA